LIGEEAYPPYERPPLSKELLVGRKTIEQTYIQPAGYWAEHGIDLRLGTRAVELDRGARRVILADGGTLDYATLVFATGGRPRWRPTPWWSASASSPTRSSPRRPGSTSTTASWPTPAGAPPTRRSSRSATSRAPSIRCSAGMSGSRPGATPTTRRARSPR